MNDGIVSPQTLLLARVLGLYLVIVGAAIMLRRNNLATVFTGLAEARLVRAILALIELLAGLFLVVMHNEWSSLPAGIISALGWLAVAESMAYLLLPDDAVSRVVNMINRPSLYLLGGALGVALGVYLAGVGFAVF